MPSFVHTHGDAAAYHRSRSRSRGRQQDRAQVLIADTATVMLERAYNHLLEAYKLSDEASLLHHRSFAAVLQAAGEICRAQQCIEAQAVFASSNASHHRERG